MESMTTQRATTVVDAELIDDLDEPSTSRPVDDADWEEFSAKMDPKRSSGG